MSEEIKDAIKTLIGDVDDTDYESCLFCDLKIDEKNEFVYTSEMSCTFIVCNKCAKDFVDCYEARNRKAIKEHVRKENLLEG